METDRNAPEGEEIRGQETAAEELTVQPQEAAEEFVPAQETAQQPRSAQETALESAARARHEANTLQKKLLWPNIAILIIALAAGLSLLLGPWLDVRVQIDEPLVQELLETADLGSDEEIARFVLKDVQTEVRVSVTPASLLQAGMADGRSGLRDLVNYALRDVTQAVASIGKQVLPAAITLAVAETVTLPEGMTYEDLDTTVFNETIELLDAQKPAEAKDSFMAAVDTFASDSLGMEIDDETRAEIESIYDEAIGLMTVDGEFSFARLPDAAQVLLDKYGNGAQLPALAAKSAASGTAARADEADDSLFAILEDPGRYVDQLDEDTAQLLKTVCLAAGIAMYAFAALWLILAIFALVHIFTPNKKVAMWYVKAFGLLPFLLFVALPIVALAVLPSFVAEMPAVAASFLGMTVVSVVCYVALWLVSIFWCHPIKKRIADAEEERRYAERAAA